MYRMKHLRAILALSVITGFICKINFPELFAHIEIYAHGCLGQIHVYCTGVSINFGGPVQRINLGF